MFGTAALTFVVYGTAVDPKGAPIVSHMAPVAIGFTVFLAHLLLVPATGCGINPARSFGSNVASGKWTNAWIYWVRVVSLPLLLTSLPTSLLPLSLRKTCCKLQKRNQ